MLMFEKIFKSMNLVSRQRAKAKKIEVLRKYDHKPLRNILIWKPLNNTDTITQHDAGHRQYPSLPYPAVSEKRLYDEKQHYEHSNSNIPYTAIVWIN